MAYQGAAAAPVFQSAAYAYQQTAQQPGLLQTGQIINVNGIIVTVERYLSQGSWQYISLRIAALPIMMSPGGFAHVYVVQSQTPISGTRQHVLKRMAVPDESMLREVKKEVDVMVRLSASEDISFTDIAFEYLRSCPISEIAEGPPKYSQLHRSFLSTDGKWRPRSIYPHGVLPRWRHHRHDEPSVARAIDRIRNPHNIR